jgi:hypothetical protein
LYHDEPLHDILKDGESLASGSSRFAALWL